jgi:Sulfotransferase family
VSATVHLDDLRDPVLSDLQRRALARAEADPAQLDVGVMLDAARAATGLDDFGPDDFLPRLESWAAEVGGDPAVTAYGRNEFVAGCTRFLVTRLRTQDLLGRHPEIADEPIERPIFIVGLPRSGTTHLLNTLASDRRLRSLPLWEAFEPVPTPGEPVTDDEQDPRFVRAAARWEAQRALMPAMEMMHPFTPDHVHEETELMLPNFGSYFLEFWFRTPRWRDVYLTTDQTPHYHYLKQMLQLLQWRRGPRRWVLKTPQHLEQLRPLMAVFPDADVVMTHRDPLAVVQSVATMITYSSRMRYLQTDPEWTCRYWIDRVARLLSACLRDLEVVPNRIDVRFHEFMRDQPAVIERIYAHVGWPVDAHSRAAFERHLAEHARGRDGQLRYDLRGDFGVEPSEFRDRFAAYMELFDVAEEVS